MKKLIALLLALVMVMSMFAACQQSTGNDSTGGSTAGSTAGGEKVEYVYPYADLLDDYEALSSAIYEDVLGEFYEYYTAAEDAANDSERFALMAIAEAKMLSSGIFLPLTSKGGNYAISRVVPYTATSTLWGNDSYRFHNLVIATEPLTAEHRNELKAMWNELKGTGTWEASAKAYLTDKGYSIKDTYSLGYSSDPQTWDVLATSMAADSEAIVNTYDGLVEYNNENELVGALAESWTVSDDGLTYTFKIKSGLSWVDSQGRKVADIKADDFVAGLQHMMDAMGGLEYLVDGLIVNATEYMNGEATFDQVGVKAVDDTTLTYTLCQPTSYFLTMLGYGVFAPMSRTYFESKGGVFGPDYADVSETDAYTYGKTPDDIAYCGPYLVTNNTPENTIVFSANPSYWNAKGINIKTITWLFNDGSEALKAYNDMKAGTIDGCGLNASAVEAAKTDKLFDTYAYVSGCDATTYNAFLSLKRGLTHNFNDETAVVSTKTEEQIERSDAAMLNKNFRLAIVMSCNRIAYNAQTVGEDLAATSLRNTYTPGTFVQLKEEVTVKINGTDKTYPAGTQYGQIIQDQLDADNVPLKAWDPTLDEGIGSSDGFDGWYNPDAAASYLQKAIDELGKQGLEISAENPIYLDLPTFTGSEAYSNRANVFKQSVETTLGGCVVINLTECTTSAEWYYAGYYPPTGAENNYDLADVSGWGPDYGDPSTYLNTILPDWAGYMTKAIGIF